MKPILYDESGNTQLGILNECIECYTTEERNGTFSLTLSYPITDSLHHELIHGRIIKCKPNDEQNNQLFRICNTERILSGLIHVVALHISFDLSYDYIDNVNIQNQSCEYALNTLFRGSQFSSHYRGYSDIVNAQNYKINNRNITDAIAGSQGSIIDTFGTGAEIKRDNTNIYVYNKRGVNKGVTIEYGVNLLDESLKVDIEDLATSIIGTVTRNVNGTEEVITTRRIDSPNINKYAHPYILYKDYTDRFSSEETITEDKIIALINQDYEQLKIDQPKCSYTLNFVPLSKCSGYEDIEDKIHLCDTVRIIDSRYNIDTEAKVIKYTYDVLTERYETMELGDPRNTLSDLMTNTIKGEKGDKGDKGDKGEDGSVGNFPDTLPATPVLQGECIGFGSIQLEWTFVNQVYYSYELYGSLTEGFMPNQFDLIHEGQTSSFLFQAEPGTTWYFKVCGVNSFGKRTEFSNELKIQTYKAEDFEDYFTSVAIGNAVVNSLSAEYMKAGVIKGQWIDAKNLSVTDGNGKRTLDIDSFGNVNLDVTSLKISSSNVATENYAKTQASNAQSNAISSANASTDNKLKNYYTSSETDTKIKVLNDSISLKASKTEVTEQINELELGTRNYQTKTDASDENILNSWRAWYGGSLSVQPYTWGKNDYPEDSFIKGKNAIRLRANIEDMLGSGYTYVACASPYVTTVEKNTTYTLSFWMYLSGNSSKFEVRAYHMLEGSLSSQLSSVTRTEYLGRFEKVTMTFTTKEISNEISLRFYNTPKSTLTTGTADIHLYQLMLSKGDKPKDWVIAQEDVGENIDVLSEKISKAELKIEPDAIVSTVTSSETWKNQTNDISGLEKRVSTAEQKITDKAIVSTVTSSENWKTQTSNISNAQSTANTAKSTADANKSDISGLTKRMSTAEQKITADAIIQTVSSTYATKTDVDNLNLGGTNYLIGTDFTKEGVLSNWSSWYNTTLSINDYTFSTGQDIDSFIVDKKVLGARTDIAKCIANDYAYGGFRIADVKLEKNTTYTFSCWVYPSKNVDRFQIRAYQVSEDGSTILNDGKSLKTITDTQGRTGAFRKLTLTFTTLNVSSTVSIRFYDYFKSDLTTGNADINIYQPMLAKGDKAKDWVIAQEEMATDISNLDTRISKAELKITDEAITTTVSKNFVPQSSFDSLELGNRNYLLYTNFDKDDAKTKWSKWGGCSLDIPTYNGGQLKDIDAHINGKRVLRARTKIETQIDNNAQYGGFAPPYVTLEKNTTYTFSCWLYQGSTVGEMQVRAYYVNRETNSLGSEIKRVTLPGTWVGSFQKVTLTFTVGTKSDLVSIRFYNYHDATLTTGNSDIMVYQPMLTKGDKAKDWVEATEEVSLGIVEAQSQITQLADEISSRVTSGDVSSIIRQSPSDIQIGFNGINDRIEINNQYLKFEAENGNKDMLLYGGQVCIYNNTDNTFMSTLGHVLRADTSYKGIGFLTGKNCNTFFIGRDSSWSDILTNRSPNPLGVFYINFAKTVDGDKGVHIRDNLYTTNNIQAIQNSQGTITGFKDITCTNSIFDNWKSVVDQSTIMRYDGAHNIYLGKNLDGNGFTADGFSTMTATQYTVSNSDNIRIARGELYDPKNGSMNRDYVRLAKTYMFGGTGVMYFTNADTADWANIYAGTIYSKQTAITSDANLKTDIKYVNIDPQTISEDSGLIAPNVNITTKDMHEFIETLPMVSYRMKDDVKNGIDDTYYGFLAQEVLYTKVGSELIKIEETINDKGETKESYRYSENKLVSFIAGALQEEIKQRKKLEIELEKLKNETAINKIEELERRIQLLEKEVKKNEGNV